MSQLIEWGVGSDGLMRPQRDGGWAEMSAAKQELTQLQTTNKALLEALKDAVYWMDIEDAVSREKAVAAIEQAEKK